jgi:hypothetical protein
LSERRRDFRAAPLDEIGSLAITKTFITSSTIRRSGHGTFAS